MQGFMNLTRRFLALIVLGIAGTTALIIMLIGTESETSPASREPAEYISSIRQEDSLPRATPRPGPTSEPTYYYDDKMRCHLDSLGVPGDKMDAWVVEVIDGDLVLATLQGHQAVIRLWGTDSPEPGQWGSEHARVTLHYMLPPGEPIKMVALGTDGQNRILALVGRPGEKDTVNSYMLRKGYSYMVIGDFSHSDRKTHAFFCLDENERHARKTGQGVWERHGFAGGIRPWDFRKENAPLPEQLPGQQPEFEQRPEQQFEPKISEDEHPSPEVPNSNPPVREIPLHQDSQPQAPPLEGQINL